jgi:hypothetical protein
MQNRADLVGMLHKSYFCPDAARLKMNGLSQVIFYISGLFRGQEIQHRYEDYRPGFGAANESD